MNFNRSLVAIVATVVVAASPALAVPTSGTPLGTIDMSSNSGSFTGEVQAAVVAAVDVFTFTLSQPVIDFGGFVQTIRLSNRDIDFTSVVLTSGMMIPLPFMMSAGDPFETWTLSVPSGLAAGNYALTLTYSKTGPALASYSGTLEVTPIPEPETYALMLAGLGVVGFVAARRRPRV